MEKEPMYTSRNRRLEIINLTIGVMWVVVVGATHTVMAQEMTEEPYGNQTLGKETTVKMSLDDPSFKLRKLPPSHPLYFEQPRANAAQLADLKALKSKQWIVPITAMKMNMIPAGEFLMGSPEDEAYRSDLERQHRVKISRPFYMGIHEVTQRQFYTLTIPDYNFEGWKFRRGPLHVGTAFHYRTYLGWGKWLDDSNQLLLENPMDCVSWITAVKYCRRLTRFERQAGRLPAGYEYRLPTEAEWEYACRAGTTGCFNTNAPLEDFLKLDESQLEAFAYTGPCHDVVGGDRTPNRFGLCDMHGNVAEWTLDTFAPYKPGFQVDPVNFENEAGQDVHINEKVTRGGSYQKFNPRLKTGEKVEDKLDEFYHFRALRIASRIGIPFDFDFNMTVGFRVVLAPEMDVPIPEVANKE
jgi:formylglycine-generating enzyme required for sulfatase activity